MKGYRRNSPKGDVGSAIWYENGRNTYLPIHQTTACFGVGLKASLEWRPT